MIREESFDLARPGGLPVRGDAYLAEGAQTGVLLVHGFKGFARWGFFPHVARRIAEVGLNAIAFDLSGSGVGADRESFTEAAAFHATTWSRDLDDIVAVEALATERGWLGARYGVFGHSRGGGEAILHADGRSRVAALATWSSISRVMRWTPTEIADWRARGIREVPNVRTKQVLTVGTPFLDDTEARAGTSRDIPAAAARLDVPWLIVHARSDETVPFEEGRSLHHGAHRGRTTVLWLSDVDHTLDTKHPMTTPSPALMQATQATAEFFRSTLA